MIGYVTIGTNDLPRAAKFYDALLADLGAKRMMALCHWVCQVYNLVIYPVNAQSQLSMQPTRAKRASGESTGPGAQVRDRAF